MNTTPGRVMTTVTTTVDTTSPSVYQIIAVVLMFIVFASLVYYGKDFFFSEWRKLFPVNELTGESASATAVAAADQDKSKSESAALDYGKSSSSSSSAKSGELMGASQPSKADPVLEGPASAEQTWCLVGEDMAGRWCIQVPTPKHCEPIRSYKTKNQCERANDTPGLD